MIFARTTLASEAADLLMSSVAKYTHVVELTMELSN